MSNVAAVRNLRSSSGRGRTPKEKKRATPQRAIPKGQDPEVVALVDQLVSPMSAYPQRMVAVHNINRCFLNAKTFDECSAVSQPLRSAEVVGSVLSLVSTGEPHSYLCLNMLHFAAFDEEVGRIMIQAKTLPLLMGMLRAPAEYELARAALSLAVSLAHGAPGGREALGACRGAAGVLAGYARRPEAECRDLALQAVDSLLGTMDGRSQCFASKKLRELMAGTGGAGADEGERKQWRRRGQELDAFYRARNPFHESNLIVPR